MAMAIATDIETTKEQATVKEKVAAAVAPIYANNNNNDIEKIENYENYPKQLFCLDAHLFRVVDRLFLSHLLAMHMCVCVCV